MKLRSLSTCLFALALIAGGERMVGFCWADEPAEADAGLKVSQDLFRVSDGDRKIDSHAIQYAAQNQANQIKQQMAEGRARVTAAAAIRSAAEAAHEAKGDEAKATAQKKLAEVLAKSFDDDMVQREKDVKQIEERLAKLREQLERRRAKKQDIIELQTKVVLNDADGLGFYDNDQPAPAHIGTTFFRSGSGDAIPRRTTSVIGNLQPTINPSSGTSSESTNPLGATSTK